MADERDRPLSSDELLRAAREEARSADSFAEQDSDDGAVGRPSARSEGDRGRGVGGEVRGSPVSGVKYRIGTSARLVPSGTWWAKLLRQEYSLFIDGQQVGRVLTSMGRDDVGFSAAARLRRTMVVLSDGADWRITADPPGPKRTKTTVFGKVKKLPHAVEDRVIAVHEGGRRLAWTEGPLGTARNDSGVVVTAQRSYDLSPVRRARKGATGSFAAVERESPVAVGPWRFTTSENLPLTVALVHWHLLMGDWAAEGSAG